jgi:drug/metabolite transporter (DMT)-like permease
MGISLTLSLPYTHKHVQVAYNTAPLWSALLAQYTLSGESMGLGGWAGGAALLAAASLMVGAEAGGAVDERATS